MKKYALAAAVAALAIGGSEARADFQYNLIYNNNVPASGAFPGGDSWTLQVKNDGANGTGSNLALAGVTLLSLNSNGTVNQNGVFYTRTWNGTSYDTTTPANNNQADFMNNGATGRPGPALSYVNFNNTFNSSSAGTYPLENAQTYTDMQAVPWSGTTDQTSASYVPNYATGTQGYHGSFSVVGSTAGGNNGAGVPDTSFTTLAQAVVPHGQQVTFDMLLSSETASGLTNVIAALPGDTDFSGVVAGNDVTTTLAHYGKSGQTWATGDFNGDGVVTGADVTLVLANYGKHLTIPPSLVSATAALVAVPEPASACILGLGIAGIVLPRRRK